MNKTQRNRTKAKYRKKGQTLYKKIPIITIPSLMPWSPPPPFLISVTPLYLGVERAVWLYTGQTGNSTLFFPSTLPPSLVLPLYATPLPPLSSPLVTLRSLSLQVSFSPSRLLLLLSSPFSLPSFRRFVIAPCLPPIQSPSPNTDDHISVLFNQHWILTRAVFPHIHPLSPVLWPLSRTASTNSRNHIH